MELVSLINRYLDERLVEDVADMASDLSDAWEPLKAIVNGKM